MILSVLLLSLAPFFKPGSAYTSSFMYPWSKRSSSNRIHCNDNNRCTSFYTTSYSAFCCRKAASQSIHWGTVPYNNDFTNSKTDAEEEEAYKLELWGALHIYGKVKGPVLVQVRDTDEPTLRLQFQSAFAELKDVDASRIRWAHHQSAFTEHINWGQLLPLPKNGNKENPLLISFAPTQCEVEIEIWRRKIKELELKEGFQHEKDAAEVALCFVEYMQANMNRGMLWDGEIYAMVDNCSFFGSLPVLKGNMEAPRVGDFWDAVMVTKQYDSFHTRFGSEPVMQTCQTTHYLIRTEHVHSKLTTRYIHQRIVLTLTDIPSNDIGEVTMIQIYSGLVGASSFQPTTHATSSLVSNNEVTTYTHHMPILPNLEYLVSESLSSSHGITWNRMHLQAAATIPYDVAVVCLPYQRITDEESRSHHQEFGNILLRIFPKDDNMFILFKHRREAYSIATFAISIPKVWGSLHAYGEVKGPFQVDIHKDCTQAFALCFKELCHMPYQRIKLTTFDGTLVNPFDGQTHHLPVTTETTPLQITFEPTKYEIEQKLLRNKIDEISNNGLMIKEQRGLVIAHRFIDFLRCNFNHGKEWDAPLYASMTYIPESLDRMDGEYSMFNTAEENTLWDAEILVVQQNSEHANNVIYSTEDKYLTTYYLIRAQFVEADRVAVFLYRRASSSDRCYPLSCHLGDVSIQMYYRSTE
jgi:hypothetical protein